MDLLIMLNCNKMDVENEFIHETGPGKETQFHPESLFNLQ
jgi:anthranilate/para-aminobenzoate synthase component II